MFSYNYKNKNKYSLFKSKLDNAVNGIISILDWGVPCFISIISNIFSFLLIIESKYTYIYLLISTFINILLFKFILNKKFTDIKNKKKQHQKKCEEVCNFIDIISPLYEKKSILTSKFNNFIDKSIGNQYNIQLIYCDFCELLRLSRFVNSTLFLLYIYLAEVNNIMIILILYQKLESSIVQFYNFLNHFNDSENSYLILQEIIKNAEYTANELQYELPLTIKINNININNNNFKLTQNYNSKMELLINQGNKILITGESGSGKTTFINAYLGYIDGITFEGNKQPLNLYSNYIIMYQTIRSDIPTSKINIKELFSIETSK